LLDLRRIPNGTFSQGSPTTEPGRESNETPRNVTISRSFWLGKVPVTRAQFSRFVTETRFVTEAEKGQNGGFGWDGKALVQKKDFTWRSPGFPQRDDDPVVLVTFGDANAFVAWASRKTGRRVRLPTEAEWEYAARAGTTTPWYGATSGDEALALGWFKPNATSTTHPVAQKRPNAFGLFDMSGNVFEWCRDIYAPYSESDTIDPENTTRVGTEPERRVLRGGSWLRDPKRGRSAARHRNPPGSRNADNGFRVAVDDDDALAPGAAAMPTNDFALAAPVGLAGSSIPSPPPAAVELDAGAASAPSVGSGRPSADGSGWSLVVAPVAAAGAVVAWVLARRKRGASSDLPLTPVLRPTEPSAQRDPQPSGSVDVANAEPASASTSMPSSLEPPGVLPEVEPSPAIEDDGPSDPPST